jgi:hypothetical protein
MKQWFVGLLMGSIAVLAPIKAIMIVVGLLIFADLILGIWASIKRGEEIKSSAMRRTISKLVVYQVAIITGFLCETYLLGGTIPISKLVGAAIGMVEIKSIFENSNSILGYDLLKNVLSKLGSDNDKPKN